MAAEVAEEDFWVVQFVVQFFSKENTKENKENKIFLNKAFNKQF